MSKEKIILYSDEDYDEFGYEDFINDLKEVKTDTCYLMTGSLGLWYGRVAGGKFIFNLEDLTSAFYDYNEVYEENGELKVKAIHHDGSNYFTLRELTQKGYAYAELRDFDDNRVLHEHLLNTKGYTRKVNLTKKIKELYQAA